MIIAKIEDLFQSPALTRDRFTFVQARDMAKLIACSWLCLILLLTSGCAIFNRQRIKEAETERDRIYQNLYVPADAIILGEAKRGGELSWGYNCVRVLVESAYGVNRPLAEIIEDYHKALLASGWELSPLYKNSNTEIRAYYQNGAKVSLDISADLVYVSLPRPNSVRQKYVTIYSINLAYWDPSTAECIV